MKIHIIRFESMLNATLCKCLEEVDTYAVAVRRAEVHANKLYGKQFWHWSETNLGWIIYGDMQEQRGIKISYAENDK